MNPLSGVLAYARAAGLFLQRPSLILWALLPAAAAVALSAAGVALAIAYGDDLLLHLWPEPDAAAWYHWAWTAGVWILRLGSAGLSVFITPWLVMLVALPLCEPLAQKADVALGGADIAGSLIGDILNSLVSTLAMLALGAGGALLFFVLGIIPGVAFITTPFVALVWTPLFVAFDLNDSSLARRQHRLGGKLRVLAGNPVRSIGLGLVGTALISIPVVNLVGLPLAVVAGVVSVRQLETRGKLPA